MIKTAILIAIILAGRLGGLAHAAPGGPFLELSAGSSSNGAKAFASVLHAGGFSAAAALPSSFVYGGQSSAAFLATWPREEKPPRREGDRTIYEITWREPGGGLVATWRGIAFRDWPAMEFQWTFRNEGKEAAKPLTGIKALDLDVASSQASFQLIHSLGGLAGDRMDSPDLAFALSETPLGTVTLSAAGGRSSNKDLPFFLVHGAQPDAGLFIGIGWSGQWQATIDGSKASALHLTAEMPGLNLALPPGETIVSPSILLGSYRGPWTTGSNLLRKMLYREYTPLLDGRKPLPPVSWNSWFLFQNKVSEQNLEAQADVAAKVGIDYFVIDSGWFDGEFPNGVGNWTLDAAKFPHGLKGMADYVEARGMKLGLWFEPERAAAGTRLAREHPEWMHGDLVDLGNPAARDWLFAMMKSFIDQAHVQWICWDFNTDPLENWNRADVPGQNGLAQIRDIMGLYALLDRVRASYPNLLIEGCSSGGRRMDLEMIKRFHTYWKSDSTNDVAFLQFHETGGETFLPGQMLNAHTWPNDLPYDTDSILGGPCGFRCDWTKLSPAALDAVREQIALARRLRPLINEDYYALFPQERDQSTWIGWQFDAPSQGKGFVVLLRPPACPVNTVTFRLHGLAPNAIYQFEPMHGASAPAGKMTGAQLLQGSPVSLPPHTSAVYLYTKIK